MSNPKRVWDSKKRAVRQGKEQVWLVDWEKVVNTNHWFAEATWTDVVYDSSWEEAQTPLQTYENWWSEDVPSGSSVTINRELSQTTGEVGTQISIYLLCENAMTLSNPEPVLEFVELVHETWEWYNKIAKYRVVAEGTKTLTFTDNITWDSDSIEFTGTPAPSVRIDRTLSSTAVNSSGSYLASVYVQVDGLTTTEQVDIQLSNSDWSVAGVYGTEAEWYNLRIDLTPYGVSECNVEITDTVTWDSDSINIKSIVIEIDGTVSIEVGNTVQKSVRIDTGTDNNNFEATTGDLFIVGLEVVQPTSWYQRGALNITGVNAGTTQIYVRSLAYPWAEAQIEATVYIAVESANFTDSEPINVIELERMPFDGGYSPVDAGEPQSQIRLEPSDSSIIEIVGESVYIGDWMIAGEVHWLSEGTATIDLYVNNVLTDQKTVIVAPFVHVQSISQWEATMSIGYGNTWSYTVPYTPNDATDPSQDISAETDDTTIATVLGISWKSSSIVVRWTWAWTTTLKYWLNTDPETVYQATVTVTWWPIQQISNIAQSISVENGTSTKVKLFDYLPIDANYDNVTVYNWDYYNISDFLLESGEYSVMINWTNEWTENLVFEFEGTTYQIPLTVTAAQ